MLKVKNVKKIKPFQSLHHGSSKIMSLYAKSLFKDIKTHIYEVLSDLPISKPSLFKGVPISIQKEEFMRIHLRQGKMFGVLVAKDESGNERVYQSFSGQLFGLWQIEGWVNPCHQPSAYRTDFLLTQMSLHQIERQLKSTATSVAHLKQQRKILSQKMTQIIQSHYAFYAQNGARIPLLEVWPSPPTGTGDCCSIKLVNACFQNRHEFVSLSEFWVGNQKSNESIENSLESILEQDFQEHLPCEQRCLPLFKWLFNLS
jgi:tRNA pseudouridine32 synthase/23S rRNA pseudouridine746 synthase